MHISKRLINRASVTKLSVALVWSANYACDHSKHSFPESTVAAAAAATPQPLPSSPPALKLLHSYEVTEPEVFEPSGLLMHKGQLLAVCDKHDNTIFEIAFVPGEGIARAHIWRTWPVTPELSGEMDFEGISIDHEGNLLLVSEEHSRVLVVPPEEAPHWWGLSERKTAVDAGLFKLKEAEFEGVTSLPGGGLLLAAERQPRGLVEVPPPGRQANSKAWILDSSKYQTRLPGRPHLDFSDLTLFEDKVFVLSRTSQLVVRLIRDKEGWHKDRAWSFSATENNPKFAYEESTYGRAEGLEITKDRVFVILDNNGNARKGDRDNTSPLLFEFERPFGM